jgi:hypothetical protein
MMRFSSAGWMATGSGRPRSDGAKLARSP